MGAWGFSIFRTREEGLSGDIIYLRLSERFEDLGALTFSFIIRLHRTKKAERNDLLGKRESRAWKRGTVGCRPRTGRNLAS